MAEPFQYSQVADLKRIDVCFVPDKGEQLKEMNSDTWGWTELELLPYEHVWTSSVFGIESLAGSLFFQKLCLRLANEQDMAWHDAQKAVLLNAEVSGVVKADLRTCSSSQDGSG